MNFGCCQAAHAGASVACPSPQCKPRNVPAQWGHLTPRGGRDKQGTVLYLAYLTVEMIFKMALTYIALTQQVLILCYLGDCCCIPNCLEVSRAQIPPFVSSCSSERFCKGGTLCSMHQNSKCVLTALWFPC